jgi:UDP-N-acetylmuramoyl-tripeptide--D-alanyl-D-alanine ligase
MIEINKIKKFKSVVFCPEFYDDSKILPITDSRQISNHNLFIAIQGEKYNPLTFLAELREKKSVKYIAYTKSFDNDILIKPFINDFIFIETLDSVLFLQELSREWSIQWQTLPRRNLIAISGSNGKTTTKEMLNWLLRSSFSEKVISTQKNNNNHIGVPLTVFQIQEDTMVAVVELGSNHPGEMKVVCEASAPNIGFTTNIGFTHMEFFPTLDDVFLEEAYLQKYIELENKHLTKVFFLNERDDFLKKLKNQNKITSIPILKYLNNQITLEFDNQNYVIENKNITGEHNFINLATSFYIACTLYPELANKFFEATKTFQPTSNRSQWIEFKNKPIYLDAYNANPSSMKAALIGFKNSLDLKGINISDSQIIIADMNELGHHTETLHGDIGALLNEIGFSNVVFIGRYAEFYRKKYKGNAKIFKNVFEYKDSNFIQDLSRSKAVFIKGSRSLQLEKLIDIT